MGKDERESPMSDRLVAWLVPKLVAWSAWAAVAIIISSYILLNDLYSRMERANAERTAIFREFAEFRKPGPRFSWDDWERESERIRKLEETTRQLELSFHKHAEWGKQWVENAIRRLDQIERNYHDDSKRGR